MPITVVPREPSKPIRAVHMSADAWASSTLRNGVLQLIDERKINTVQLDLKDESGVVGWPAVPFAKEIGAVRTSTTSRARSSSSTTRASG